MTYGQNQFVLSPQGNWLSFKLPREYGAIVVFVLASMISLVLSAKEFAAIACLQLCLWPLILSAHRPKQLLLLSFLAMAVIQLFAGLPFALWTAAVAVGIFAVSSPSLHLGALLRESIGLSGAALTPLVFSCLLGYTQGLDLSLHLASVVALLAATLTSSTMIYLCRKQRPVALVLLVVLSFLLWLGLTALNAPLAALSLVVYVLQGLWLLPVATPSYKQLGQVQSLCLLWVSIAIVLHVLKLIA
ncbi:MAG: hypothetical protein C0473_00085 [Cyanobacteria bacterium DS3.002]|jgi:hypothetical protein|nr:hypothetical protein [Cyanobacteria bacterium DS3.002]MBA4049381.1 hypothetical protein [Cyanobacteria bacterium DS2.008]MBA4077123.1 hypothetical protein [Cyanobacteria bacterium PR.023]